MEGKGDWVVWGEVDCLGLRKVRRMRSRRKTRKIIRVRRRSFFLDLGLDLEGGNGGTSRTGSVVSGELGASVGGGWSISWLSVNSVWFMSWCLCLTQ